MTQSKHTPGPWHINRFKGDNFRVSPHEYGCSRPYRIAELINNEANAHLIAAAPELLEALEGLVNVVSNWEEKYGEGASNITAYFDAKKAIAKAKGELS